MSFWLRIFRELNEFDWRELSATREMGAWPTAVKTVVIIALMAALLLAGYALALRGLQQHSGRLAREAAALALELNGLAASAARLDSHREWALASEAPYLEILRQLPYESGIPALIDDIAALELAFNIEHKTLDLPAEKAAPHYVEQTIDMRLIGSYHELGAFLAGLAGLDRIVSSHEFLLRGADDPGQLELALNARSYRYRPLSGEEAAAPRPPRLPEPLAIEDFRYEVDTSRDPFAPADAGNNRDIGDSGPLTVFSPDELRLVGLLHQENGHSGLVRDPAGGVHRVWVGDSLGGGWRIGRISPLGVELVAGQRDETAAAATKTFLDWEENQ